MTNTLANATPFWRVLLCSGGLYDIDCLIMNILGFICLDNRVRVKLISKQL